MSLRRGDWTVSSRYAQIETAHDWGMSPSAFWAASDEDQAYMMAYTQTTGKMAAYIRQVAEDKR